MTESGFWKLLTWILGLLLLTILTFNLSSPTIVPPAVTAFLLGCLFSIAVGYSIISPESSPIRLPVQEEEKYRKHQYMVGMIISISLSATLLIEEVRAAPLSWGLIPLIALTPTLILREYILKIRKKTH